MSVRLTRRVVPKSASYTIVYPMDAPGTVFTNRDAAGPVTFTLPSPGRQLLGVEYEFLGVAAQNLIVAGATAGDLVGLNDTAADSLAMQTAGQIIGGWIRAVCVESAAGTFQWAVEGTTEGVTYTKA